MSQTVVAIFAALIGSVVAFFGAFLSRLWDKFGARVGAMEVVRSEIEAAGRTINDTIDKKLLWPASRQLRSRAWEEHGAELASHLKQATWRALDCHIRSLERMENWANEVRDEQDEARIARFGEKLGEVAKGTPIAIDNLDTAIEYAYSRRRRGVAGALASIAILAGIGVAVVSASSPQTRTEVAKELENQIPGARHAVCEKSKDFEGAYRCVVKLGGCQGQLEASTGKPQCSAGKTALIKVASDSGCDFYEQEDLLRASAPRAPPGKTKEVAKSVIEWICKKR